MPFQIRKANRGDLLPVCRIYYKSFMTTTLGKEILPKDPATCQDGWENAFREDITNDKVQFFVVTDLSSNMPNEPVGFAKWNSPEVPMIENVRTPKEAWQGYGNAELVHDFFVTTLRVREIEMTGKSHWNLELMAVKPEYVGKGVGSLLMKWGVEKADSDGLPIYVDSVDSASPFYEKFGFKTVGTLDFQSSGGGTFLEYCMIRDPVVK